MSFRNGHGPFLPDEPLSLLPSLEERGHLDDLIFERRASVAERFEDAQNSGASFSPRAEVARTPSPRPATAPTAVQPSPGTSSADWTSAGCVVVGFFGLVLGWGNAVLMILAAVLVLLGFWLSADRTRRKSARASERFARETNGLPTRGARRRP